MDSNWLFSSGSRARAFQAVFRLCSIPFALPISLKLFPLMNGMYAIQRVALGLKIHFRNVALEIRFLKAVVRILDRFELLYDSKIVLSELEDSRRFAKRFILSLSITVAVMFVASSRLHAGLPTQPSWTPYNGFNLVGPVQPTRTAVWQWWFDFSGANGHIQRCGWAGDEVIDTGPDANGNFRYKRFYNTASNLQAGHSYNCTPAVASTVLYANPVHNQQTCAAVSNSKQQGNQCICNPGTTELLSYQQCVVNPSTKAGGICTGNPCNPSNGIKTQRETVYSSQGINPIALDLTYDSTVVGDPIPPWAGAFGKNWIGAYERRIKVLANGAVTARRPGGREWEYRPPSSGTRYTADADVTDILVRLINESNATVGWRLTAASGDRIEIYDASGKLISIADRNGLVQTMTYSSASTPQSIAPAPGLLILITDAVGRQLQFNYNAGSRVNKVVDPQGGEYLFTYTTNGILNSIVYPDAAVRIFHYGESANTSGATLPVHLTGITDENNVRFANYHYDTQGRTIVSEHAGGADRYAFSYNANGTTLVTDSLNTARTFSFTSVQGVAKNAANTLPCVNCGSPYPNQTYDANGNVASRTDWNGNRTNFTYDLTRNLETSRTEAVGTPQARTISTEWHPTYRLPTRIAEPFRITTLVYGESTDANPGNRGSLLSRTMQATTDATGAAGLGATLTGAPRTWTYTYNANGSVLTLDGPRTDIADLTTYTYYANNDADLGKRGNIATITNAAGHVTSIPSYNAHGQPLTIIDPNGLATTLTYDARQRLTSRNVGGELTTYTYDGVGQLTRVTLPDGSYLDYTYDAAHRLTQIADSLGNRIAYTLDAMGNRLQEQVLDPFNQLAQTRSRVYNSLNRLAQEIGAASQTTSYAYDNQGNITSIDGPLAGPVDVTTHAYDALNRLTRVTDPNAGQVNYGYNGLDQLTAVTDPRSLVTSYGYDGLNNLNQQVSPDTGATLNTYDAAGNLLTQTDAKGQTTAYTYDALNRVTVITYTGGVTHTYQYDQGANGMGRLTQITEPNSVTQYAYDQQGRLLTETRTINAIAYVTGYSYDSAGRLTAMTYPGGRQVAYTLDALGRIQQITTTKGTTTQTVLANVTYRPFGTSQAYTFGNGQSYNRGFDQDGRIASYTLGNQSIAVGYDAASRIGFLSEVANPANTTNYTYDNLDRLTGAATPGTPYAYSYDAVGNRLSRTVGSATLTYDYAATSNRLTQTTGTGSRNYSYDPNGSTVNDGANQFAYDGRGRLIQSAGAVGPSHYQINSVGQRIRKTNTQGDTVYHYDAQGRLIAESSAGGATQKEYIYLGDAPVAVIQ